MSKATWRRERISFRFIDITDEQLSRLQLLSRGVVPDKPSLARFKRVAGRIAVIPLAETEDYGWIESFIEQEGIPSGSRDVFLSLSTESESEIIEAPAFAVDLAHRTHSKLLFSFTVVPSSDEGDEEQDST